MWTTVALWTVLTAAPAQGDGLTLTNIRMTHGILGVRRQVDGILPGDSVDAAFDINGISVDPNGKVKYTVALVITNQAGKVLYKQEPTPQEAVNSLGGSTVPAHIHLDVGLDSEPGEYTSKLTVTDLVSKKSATLSRTNRILPKGFGIVRVMTTNDQEERVPANFLGVGDSLWVNFRLVGFERGANKQPNVRVEMRILDETGKPTLALPFSGEINANVNEKQLSIPVQFLVSLNRAGKFSVEIKAVDQLRKKESQVVFPLTVHSAN